MKFNKLTHISIITLFAIIFIVVYLYYTISDVKRIHKEVNKLSIDIQKIDASIASMKASIVSVLNVPSILPQTAQVVSTMPIANVCMGQTCPQPHQDSSFENADSESVNSEELHNIIETIEDKANNDIDY